MLLSEAESVLRTWIIVFWHWKKFPLVKTMIVQFYTAIIEAVLICSITIWCAASTVKDKCRLLHVIQFTEKLIQCNLPFLFGLYTSRTERRAGRIIDDSFHPGQGLLVFFFPSGRRLWSINTRTSQHQNSSQPTQHCTCFIFAPILFHIYIWLAVLVFANKPVLKSKTRGVGKDTSFHLFAVNLSKWKINRWNTSFLVDIVGSKQELWLDINNPTDATS